MKADAERPHRTSFGTIVKQATLAARCSRAVPPLHKAQSAPGRAINLRAASEDLEEPESESQPQPQPQRPSRASVPLGQPPIIGIVAPLLGLLLFLVVLLVGRAAGLEPEQSFVAALVLGSTVALLDTRFLSIELTSLLILATLVISRTLTFQEALSGARFSSIWLVWVGSVAGAAFDSCKLSDWVVERTLAGAPRGDHIGLLPLLVRVGGLSLATSLAVPSAVSRNLFLVPLAKRFAKVGELSDEQTEAVAATLIFGATKPGMGLLTGYVTSMLVADTYNTLVGGPAAAAAAVAAAAAANLTTSGGGSVSGGMGGIGGGAPPPPPVELAWSTYAIAMLPVWGVGSVLLIVISVYVVYRPLVSAAKRERSVAAQRAGSQRLWRVARTVVSAVHATSGSVWEASHVGVAPFASFDDDEPPSPHQRVTLGGSGLGGGGSGSRFGPGRGFRPCLDLDARNSSLPSPPPPPLRPRKAARLSSPGARAIGYLFLAVAAWAILGGSVSALPRVDKGAVGLALVILLYAPRPIGVADVAELRTAKSYGAVIYLCAVLALQAAVDKVGLTTPPDPTTPLTPL